MADSSSPSKLSITRLILVPAVITLAVTFLRLAGELMRWSSVLFSRAEGGGGAIVGISWLPIIFGPYFAVKLWDRCQRPSGSGKTIGYALLGFLMMMAGATIAFAPVVSFPGRVVVGLLLIAVAAALQFVPWRALAGTLIAYAYAARIPVAIVMFFAMLGHWGTHYDAAPPEPIPSGFWPRYFTIALAPQLVMWVAYTMTLGALFGGAYVAITRRKKTAPAPSSQPAAGA